MTRYIVTGHYCPTDANPEKDRREELTEVGCRTRKEAELMLLWYPDGTIRAVQ